MPGTWVTLCVSQESLILVAIMNDIFTFFVPLVIKPSISGHLYVRFWMRKHLVVVNTFPFSFKYNAKQCSLKKKSLFENQT